MDWELLDKIGMEKPSATVEEIPVFYWEQLEQLENLHKAYSLKIEELRHQLSVLDTRVEKEEPWKLELPKPVDWAKELGASKFSDEEQQKVDLQALENEAAWAADPVDTKELRSTQAWLKELPGGFANSLDFLQILSRQGEKAFIRYGTWYSRFGNVDQKVRQRLYAGGGRKWYNTNVLKAGANTDKWGK
ncbi:hypothetical protein PSTT_13438, partial [Puccinia striiformis]